YMITRYRSHFFYYGGTVASNHASLGLLSPLLSLAYQKPLSQKLSLLFSLGAAADLFRPDGEFLFFYSKDSLNYVIERTISSGRKQFFLTASIGLVKSTDNKKRYELRLLFQKGVVKDRANTFSVYTAGNLAEVYENSYYRDNAGVQLIFFLRERDTR
ncbi:MAG: hypothetical protein AB1458_10870, partial [Bacteroidota bacterium]